MYLQLFTCLKPEPVKETMIQIYDSSTCWTNKKSTLEVEVSDDIIAVATFYQSNWETAAIWSEWRQADIATEICSEVKITRLSILGPNDDNFRLVSEVPEWLYDRISEKLIDHVNEELYWV